MSAPALPDPATLGALLGPQLIGLLLNFCLFGVLTVQTYVYHLSFPNDKVQLRLLVAFVFVYELVSTIMSAIDAFNWFASGFGNLAEAVSPGLSPIYSPMGEGFIASVVQLYFCYRIWIIEPKAWWLSIFIACMSLLSGAGGIAAGVTGEIIKNFAKGASAQAAKTSIWLWLVAGAITDILVAATMSFLLLRARSSTSRRSNAMIERIVQLVVETNAATAFVAIVSIALYAGCPGKSYFLCPTFILGKLYSNTLLLTFNNRAFAARPESMIDVDDHHESLAPSAIITASRGHVAVAQEIAFTPKNSMTYEPKPRSIEPNDMRSAWSSV
ncbi:hypothetical protein C8J56DRAFT_1110281 [Mycena floridula]|nr:hypothetical protein C8J56DRAFT_1110281 [Mycena floridula]